MPVARRRWTLFAMPQPGQSMSCETLESKSSGEPPPEINSETLAKDNLYKSFPSLKCGAQCLFEEPHLTCMWHPSQTHQFTELEIVPESLVRSMDLGMSVLYPGENVENNKDIKLE